jgi:DNA polymerase
VNLPFKTILALDFETRWDRSDYTLSKLTTEHYIRDERFKAFGCCIHEYGTDKPTQWYRHAELPKILRMYDWTKTAVLAHNAMFDVGILSIVYGVQPCFIFDSLSMARALRGVEVGNSLAKLAKEFELPPKGNAVHSTDGLVEISREVEKELAEYCKHDVFLCEEIFTRLLTGMHGGVKIADPYPSKELRLIDMTLRMFTNPQIVLDVPMLEKARDEENEKLRVALERVGVAESDLASNGKFAEILEGLGVIPPTKKKRPTPKTPNPVGENFAFAKNDAHFQQMLNGDNEDVALLCEARLRVKSTLERTRSQRFIDIASRGNLPIPLKYYGAETGRWSGTDQINLQNMKRGSFLRKALMAPDGYVVVAGDLSQIEPRVLAWLAGYDVMLELFRAGGDPYATFGSQMFSIPGLSKDSHPLLRQSAKSALLGAGYGLGWAAFSAQLLVGFLGAPPQRYTKDEAKQLGVHGGTVERFINNKWHMEKMMEIPHTCTDKELLVHCLAAKAIIEKYRSTAEPVTDYWKLNTERIEESLIGGEEYNHKDVLLFRKEEIVLANGMSLKYPEIEVGKNERGHKEYTYNTGKARGNLYFGKLVNNCTQGLARIVMSDAMLRVSKRYDILFTVHDELGIIAPEQEAEEAKAFVTEQMVAVPKWMSGIPLNCEVGYAKRYGLAK